MAFTMSEVVDKARLHINDIDKVRLTDTDLLGLANDFVLLARNKRPDLFYGQFLTLSTTEKLALGAAFPLPNEYVPVMADYIVAMAEAGNDEAVLTQRTELFLKMVAGQI